jgi:hypothetical protein
MAKICYIKKNFTASTLEIIEQANNIIEEYQEEGLDLTLRQLYYQFVSRDLIANKQTEYKRLGSIVNDGRLAGLIDWDCIEDRTRDLKSRPSWENPGEIIETAARSFKLDRWENQTYQPEVWIEKEALTGVISGICRKLDVPYFACKGYVSQSEMWVAADRILYRPQTTIIIHLGDHDPSGIDMTRDIIDRLNIFEATDCKVKRIALTMDQISHHRPPPNPAKLTDSRCKEYMSKYGSSSWELDALEPRVLTALIKDTVLRYRDEDAFNITMDKEAEYHAILKRVANNWEDI